jgi:hypothetical protein
MDECELVKTYVTLFYQMKIVISDIYNSIKADADNADGLIFICSNNFELKLTLFY